MEELLQLQDDLHEWRVRNFPDSCTPTHQLLGVVEEVGELSHSLLKQQQGIRGTYEEHKAAMKDAIGDIVIYLMGFCSANEWDFDKILEDTARSVMGRDWVNDPLRGAPE